IVGVLATPATFQSALYASVVERFGQGVHIFQDPCPGLVQQIESGDLTGPRIREILENALAPMLSAGIDTVVMGCTHYPFVIPLIQEIVGSHVRVIDPAPAVARQVGRMLESYGWLASGCDFPPLTLITSGPGPAFERLLPQFLGRNGQVEAVSWLDHTIQPVLGLKTFYSA
ncbi:MAG: aspartate/glutamate racemase family protein, partial [Saprospiraceae bacterium]|nr:aspartate/glutamate racemase family protein [Saprospiraceae bacterium]